MLKNNFQIFAIVPIILMEQIVVPFIKPVMYCLKESQIECYPCEVTDLHDGNCVRPTRRTKVINFRSNRTPIVNYDWYVNSNIKIIQEHTKFTFYSCNSAYFQVSRNSYYPIKGTLHLRRVPMKFGYHRTHNSFQTSLENYCKMPTNKFRSTEQDVDSLDFVLSGRITSECLQNITTATIVSNRITVLKKMLFFEYADNLVNLKLEFMNLEAFSCVVFENLTRLSIIEFPFTIAIHIESYKCILHNNRNLVKIQVGSITIWNNCDEGYGLGTKCLVLVTEPIPLDGFEDNSTGGYRFGFPFAIFLAVVCIIVTVGIIIVYYKPCGSNQFHHVPQTIMYTGNEVILDL